MKNTTKQLVFKIDETMAQNKSLSLTDVAVLATISQYRNNNITEFRYGKNIAEKLSISPRTVDNAIRTLKDNNAFAKIEKVNVKGDKEFRNKYFFTPLDEKFILVSNAIFESGLTADEIGFLIRAKSKAYNNGLTLKGNKEKLAGFIGVSVGKFNKLFKSLIEKGFISYSNSELFLNGKLFKDTSKRAVAKAKQLKMWSDMANEVLKNNPHSKEAKMIVHYFIDKKEPVKHPVALIKRIITGVRANSNRAGEQITL